MDRWTFRGLLHNNTAATWGPTAASMNFWCPDAVWDPVRRRVVLYFTNQGAGGGPRARCEKFKQRKTVKNN